MHHLQQFVLTDHHLKNVYEKNNYRSVCTAASTLLMPDWSGRKNNLKTQGFPS